MWFPPCRRSGETENTSGGLRSDKEEKLYKSERLGHQDDRLNRSDLYNLSPDRHVIALVGITGAGKSSCANNLIGGGKRKFKVRPPSLLRPAPPPPALPGLPSVTRRSPRDDTRAVAAGGAR